MLRAGDGTRYTLMKHTLKELLSGISYRTSTAFPLDVPIRGISMDTRLLRDENLFLVMGGQRFSGSDVLTQLSTKNVEYVLMDMKEERSVPAAWSSNKKIIFVEGMSRSAMTIADRFYHYPQKDLSLIGITGTNGKTTTAYMLFQALNAVGIKTACVGTVRYWIDVDTSEPAVLTTPDFLTLRKILRSAVDRKVTTVVMEASSHALQQGRLQGLLFSCGIFTNLTQDHLDYHRNLANYFEAKSRLFTRHLEENGVAVINSDDERGSVLLETLPCRKSSYGIGGDASFRAGEIIFHKGSCRFRVRTPSAEALFECGFFGMHNVYNSLAAVSALSGLNIGLDEIRKIFKAVKLPRGRLERISSNIFVDYAHTPDALKNSLCSLRESGYGTIIVVFGCGGDRDKTKRPLMGMVASALAEHSIITTDNPRSEDAESICEQIRQGYEKSKSSPTVILDRREALAEGIDMVQRMPDAALLVAGKGHEEYQIFSTGRTHFSDQEEIMRILNLPVYEQCR